MDVRQKVVLTPLQRAMIAPVVDMIVPCRRHRPITKARMAEILNADWYGIIYPKEKPTDKIKERDVEKVIQYLKNLPRPDQIYFCSNGNGYYLPTTISDFDSMINNLKSRIKWLSRNLRNAKAARKDLALGTGTPNAKQPDIFSPAEKPPQSGGSMINLHRATSPGNNPPGGGNE